ncbi:PadR family transcriptional regulator [Nonomuraea ferruginea]
MSVVRLLVLGAVRRRGSAHGYQVRSDLESWGAHEWAGLKPGSIYHALRQMAAEGLLRADEEAPSTAGWPATDRLRDHRGGRGRLLRAAPPRALQGRPAARHAERRSGPDGRPAQGRGGRAAEDAGAGAGGVAFPGPARLVAGRGPGGVGHGGGEVLGMWVHTAESAAEWTRGLIERLERGAYVMAGEKPRTAVSRPDRG